MSADQLASLIESEPALENALEIVIKRSNGGEEELDWKDVRDALSSGQWGRLIQQGILVEGSTGFTLDDPNSAKQLVASAETESSTIGVGSVEDVPSDVSWSWWDKGAGAVAIVLFMGYSQPHIRNVIASVDNVVLAPLDAVLPFYLVILVLSVMTGLYSTVLQANLMDQEKMKQFQERMQQIQEKLERAKERDDDEAVDQIQKEQREAMGDQLGMFKLQFRPMVWIMLITIPIFLWMRWKIRAGHVSPDEMRVIFPLIGSIGWREAAVGPMPAWIVWYFLCSMGFRQIIQKTLNLQTSPE